MEKTKEQYISQLKLLPTRELEDILELSIQPENTISETMIEAILDILDTREPRNAPSTTPEEALSILKKYYITEDAEEQSLYPSQASEEQPVQEPPGTRDASSAWQWVLWPVSPWYLLH